MQQGFCLKREHALVEEGSELTAEDLKKIEEQVIRAFTEQILVRQA